MKSLLSVAYHQCNIFSNHFTYSPSTSSPSMTITIYHQHHYHHYYHHGLCHHYFHPAINHPLLHAMCPLFVSLCDSIQTYSVIVPAEAVCQPDQLHFDDARTCLALQLQLKASTTHLCYYVCHASENSPWRMKHFTACNIQFPECRRLTLFSCVKTILTSWKACVVIIETCPVKIFAQSVENFSIPLLHL